LLLTQDALTDAKQESFSRTEFSFLDTGSGYKEKINRSLAWGEEHTKH